MKACATCGHEEKAPKLYEFCIYTKAGKNYTFKLPFVDEYKADKFRDIMLFDTGMTWNGEHITADMIEDIVLDWKE